MGSAFGISTRGLLEPDAVRVLHGLGDARLGEWREWSGAYMHIRRRLTRAEESQVGPVRDIRRTAEARMRACRLPEWVLPLLAPDVIRDELGLA